MMKSLFLTFLGLSIPLTIALYLDSKNRVSKVVEVTYFDGSKSQIALECKSNDLWLIHAKNSKLKRDKKLPKEFYRNRFCAGETPSEIIEIKELVSCGYMAAGTVINQGQDTLYYVTDLGIERFREEFMALM